MLKKSSRKGALITALLTSNVIWGYYGIVHAEEPSQAFTLDPMVVTAQRMETRDLDTPAAIDVLTEQDIKDSGAKTVFDALSFVTGVTNFSYGPGGLDYGAMDSRVNIRGFERGALILVNGAPINLNSKNSLDGIMADNVERIEVLKGASSVLYGAEAFGGVVKTSLPKKAVHKKQVPVSVPVILVIENILVHIQVKKHHFLTANSFLERRIEPHLIEKTVAIIMIEAKVIKPTMQSA